ncbi:sensor histidine kinase [Paenibacillus durus]|uniref:histidine kinase n=1 Tax=Paenibacillus durus ATCC 35681 TaxID=1333534 RepID=A0A0F7FBX1_PAEDU|nr:ATP-binding protein [Paenibacillus durus]AKG36239.1 hypothetical protein VK70_18130 [Paenibacillus durus ATCC 35681]
MIAKQRFVSKTEFVLFAAFSCLAMILFIVFYFTVLSISDSSLAQYKKQYLEDQSYKLAFTIRDKLTEEPLSDLQAERIAASARQFSAEVRYFSPDGETLWFDSFQSGEPFAEPFAVQIPMYVNGQLTGNLHAYYDLSRNTALPFLSELQRNMKRRNNFLFAIFLCLVLGLNYYLARKLAKPLKPVSRSAESIVSGSRDVIVGPKRPAEVAQLVHTINHLVLEFNRQEEWRKQLMQDLTHELRTPLTSVLSRLEALIDGVYPASEENFNKIYAEIDRLYRMVNDMQKLSEAEAARFQLNMRPVNLSQLVNDVYESFLFIAKEKDISFILHPLHAPCIVEADPDRMIQVLSNLISNAFKYSPSGGKVEIGITASDDSITIYCLDNGIGMKKEDLGYIFNRFYRVDKSRSRSSGGLGVGLSIVKALVDAHGGSIEVNSRFGAGSTFVVSIPRIERKHRGKS